MRRSPQHLCTLCLFLRVKLAQRFLGILSKVLLIGPEVCGDLLNLGRRHQQRISFCHLGPEVCGDLLNLGRRHQQRISFCHQDLQEDKHERMLFNVYGFWQRRIRQR